MDVLLQVIVLLWVACLVLSLRWARVRSRGANVATWLGLTVVSWWFEFVVVFVVVHAIFFALGRGPALVACTLTLAIFTLTPAAWMYGLGHWHARPPAHG